MASRGPVLGAVVACLLGAAPAVAAAQPTACEYTLSPPQVVQLSGNDVVTATLTPASCDLATPYLSVACLHVVGDAGPGRCEENSGTLAARVYVAPYRPGATYVATGKGCANKGNPPQPVCASTGPLTATL
jgi:hypothetical protein